MKTIMNNVTNEIIIKNSRFICCLYKIKNTNEAIDILNHIRLEYKDATHCCYAYIVDNLKKSSDDGEPGGTAGVPIMMVLENNDLTNILAVVIRYFGGIKLGAGGLVRAYTKSVTSSIEESNVVSLISGYNIDIEFTYNQIKEIDYLLRDIKINNKEFNDIVNYNIDIPIDFLENIKLANITYKIRNNIYIEK